MRWSCYAIRVCAEVHGALEQFARVMFLGALRSSWRFRSPGWHLGSLHVVRDRHICLSFYCSFTYLLFKMECAPCGRTTRSNTPSEVLVFHQTLSTLESKLHRSDSVEHTQGRTQIIHVFPPVSNNENEFTILSIFHTTRVLRNILLQYQVQSTEFKQRNYNKHLTIRYEDPSVPTRRILHTTATRQAAPATGVNKP